MYLADDPTSFHYHIPEHVKKSAVLKYKVKLPKGLTCQQCVVQWTYRTGNTWAECDDGTGQIGCGDQEIFRNCADVRIESLTSGRPPLTGSIYPQVRLALSASTSPVQHEHVSMTLKNTYFDKL